MRTGDTPGTVVFVHAHPDDETLFTGVRIARLEAEGGRSVIVTMTNGSLGFDPSGRTPLEDGHDEGATAMTRSEELRAAVDVLGAQRVVEFGIPDSGMAGWSTGEDPGRFLNHSSEPIIERLVTVFEEESPCVVVTYADDGFYGHPDHIRTHGLVMDAARRCEGVTSVEAVVMTDVALDRAIMAAEKTGEELPEWLGRRLVFTHSDALVFTIEGEEWSNLKQEALRQHKTQIDNRSIASLSPEVFREAFGSETYRVLWSHGGDRLE